MRFLNSSLATVIGAVVLSLVACGGSGGSGGGGSSPAPVTPPPAIATPSAPSNLVATAGRASATVSFTAPNSNGGSAVTGYTVTASPAGGVDRDAGSSALSHVVTGLSNGVSYTFTVTATNAAGTSPASSASNPVTPSQPVQWSATGSLQTARSSHSATLLSDGKVLVVGGATSSVEVYDPATRVWKVVGAAIATPYGPAATNLLPNGKLLIDFALYDIANNTVTTTRYPDGFSVRNQAAVLLPNGKVLAMGGYMGDNTNTNKAYFFDSASNTWTAAPSMVMARSGHTATLLPGGKILVAGGTTGNAELFDPVSNTWTFAAKSPVNFFTASATLLPNGKVLFVPKFGYDQRGIERNASLYDPATDSWTLAGTVSTDRVLHTATLLTNGTVLLVGGGHYDITGRTTATDVCELYDPATNTWALTGALILGPRAGHTATLLRDGSVLVVGGSEVDGFGQPTRADAALY